MDLQRSYAFIVFIVILIHEVVFSECDLKTKTHDRLIKSYVDGFQRKERQAPIDPSRMYLPPRADSVAAGGFGDRNTAVAYDNFGGNAAEGYGEVALVQDASAAAGDGAGSSYGVQAGTADNDGGSSSDGKTAGAAAPERADLGRYLQQNDNSENYGGGGPVTTTAGNDDRSGFGQGVAAPPGPSGYGIATSYGHQNSNASPASYAQQQQPGSLDDLRTGAAAPTPTDEGNGAWSSGYQGGYDRQEPVAASSAAGYGLSSTGGGFDQGTTGRPTAAADGNYGRPRSSSAPAGFVGRPQMLRPSNDGRSASPENGAQGRSPSDGAGFDQSQRGTTTTVFDGYGPTEQWSRPPSTGNSYGQYHTRNSPATYGVGGYTRGGPYVAAERNDYSATAAQANTPRDGLHATRSSVQPSATTAVGSSSGQPSRFPAAGVGNGVQSAGSSSTKSPTDYRNNESQNKKKHSTVVPKAQYQNSNLPSDGDVEKQADALRNANNNGDFGEPGPNAFSNFAPGNQLNPPVNPNADKSSYYGEPGPNAFSNFAPGNQLSPPVNLNDDISNYDAPGSNAFSNYAPGNELSPPVNLNDDKSNYGAPGSNAFSNFAPGSQLSPTVDLNDDKSNYGAPGSNAFSNFAPGNQLSPPVDLNDDKSNNYGEPSSNAFSNLAPGNQLKPPVNLNYDEPGSNAFSNFAPGNQLNPSINLNDNSNYGEPGSNAFSNFAPGNQPNSPTNLNNNDCGTNNQDNNRNAQKESVFSASNTGY